MAISVVQTSTQVSIDAATSGSVTMSGTVTVGNYLIASNSFFAPGGGTLVMSDDKGNSWSEAKLSTGIGGGTPSNFSSIWFAKVTTGGTVQVTWGSMPSGSYVSAAVIEVSGLAASSVVDKAVENSGLSLTTYTGPDTTALSQADEIVIAALGSSSAAPQAITARTPSGITSIFTEPSGATHQYGDGWYKIVSATTAIQPTWDISGGINCTVSVVTFKAAGAGGSVIKTFDGIANASTKTVIAVANASVKTFDGVSNQ